MIGKIMKAASFKRCVQYVTGKEDPLSSGL